MPLCAAVIYVAAFNVCALLCLQVAALHARVYRPGFSFAVQKDFLMPFPALTGSTSKMNILCFAFLSTVPFAGLSRSYDLSMFPSGDLPMF